MRSLSLFVIASLFGVLPRVAEAVSSDPVTEDNGNSSSLYVGLTLGDGWEDFPVHMTPDYENSSAVEQLNATLPLYVTWILDPNSNTVAQPVNPPQPITNYSWFTAAPTAFKVTISDVVAGTVYNLCASGNELEAPALNAFPLTSSGELNVQDIHGGIGTTTLIRLSRFTNSPTNTQGIFCYLGWTSPATRIDAVNGTVHLVPGDIWTRSGQFTISGQLYEIRWDTMVAEWPSADFGNASPRQVEASDAAAFASAYGCCGGAIRWGHTTESPASSPTFQADLANAGTSQHLLDSSDISAFATDWGKGCGLSKVRNEEEVVAMMAWFGFAPTGDTITVDGVELPEYANADPEQREIGIADPYGFLDHIEGVQTIPWGGMKRLYR